MLADAARRARELDVDVIVSRATLGRAGLHAVGAVAILLVVFVSVRHTARQAVDAAALTLFPARVGIDVTPGNARVKAGTALTIQARLAGNSAPVAAQLQVASGDTWRIADMTTDPSGAFRFAVDSVSTSFKYRVIAGGITSPSYEVTVVRPPRVARGSTSTTPIPPGCGLSPRTETDSGDIYAPPGTEVRLHIVTRISRRPRAAWPSARRSRSIWRSNVRTSSPRR